MLYFFLTIGYNDSFFNHSKYLFFELKQNEKNITLNTTFLFAFKVSLVCEEDNLDVYSASRICNKSYSSSQSFGFPV